jgi:hypothetical protein
VSCTDTTNTATLSLSDTVEVRIQNAAGTLLRNVAWTVKLG